MLGTLRFAQPTGVFVIQEQKAVCQENFRYHNATGSVEKGYRPTRILPAATGLPYKKNDRQEE
jgi:hypothetical protein